MKRNFTQTSLGNPKRRLEKVDCARCVVRDRLLFAGLDVETDRLVLSPIDHYHFEPGATIYHQGQQAPAVYSIRNGSVKLSLYSSASGDRIVRLLGTGSAIGLEALIEQDYQHSAVTIGPTNLCRIPVSTLHQLGKRQPELYQRLMAQWQEQSLLADNHHVYLTQGPVQKRVINLLCILESLLSDQFATFYLPSNQDCASLLATSEESVSRAMAALKRQGFLRKASAHNWSLC
ncbi:cAMP-binding domain of CRP or a regulatory subunit of cAMP-dependent protein kinases [Ferrimonas sediminum]|uniref:cAMP-binding domain of CRP or a regulatory subunit of cAMP-dependent protein kinases n=1 Tax=Ferrimonas sediminum TaxID=718193 RepID=A0A1G8RM29_9GAMM|nr:Crp/Fnr family transcriptional regulator [Ferrimonas sediminum]SDJ17440.1 cAMP-binding domain of CRP or a regulatory subunit of cAMP-dependent protein kinases [Ferrimonas sediminum]